MAPKKGAKGAKGKKGGIASDEEWDRKAAAKASTPTAKSPVDAGSDDENEAPATATSSSRGGFASLGMDVDDGGEDDDGGLMGAATRAMAAPKKAKRKAKPTFEDEDEAAPTVATVMAADDDALDDLYGSTDKPKKSGKSKKKGDKQRSADSVDGEPAPVDIPPTTAPVLEPGEEDLDDLYGATSSKPAKKGKAAKASKKSKQADPIDEDALLAEAAASAAAAAAALAASKASSAPAPATTPSDPVPDHDDDGEPSRVLSKSEKEKLKKEKEKAKKKAQVAAKKAAGGNADDAAPASESTAPGSATVPSTTEPAPADDDGEDDATATASGKKGKKKKGKSAAAAVPPAEAAPTKSAGGGRLAVLREAMEAKRLADEAAARALAEEKQRIEEEERKAAEAERAIIEARERKKEREKAKRDQLRREGKLLTPKQKAEQAAALARREALLATAGVSVGPSTSSSSARDKRKKPDPAPAAAPSAPAPSEPELPPAPAPAPAPPAAAPVAAADDGVKDDWDAPEPTPEAAADDVKEDWDASDESEDEKSAPFVAPLSGTSKLAVNGVKPAPSAPTNGKGKAAATAEASSSEEDDSDEDSDSGDSDDSDDDDSSDVDEPKMSAARLLEQKKREEAAIRREERHKAALAARSADNLRSPICCILGHVDTGKTKLLDKVRQTNVQEGEAGGITQQIGATFFPMDAIKRKTSVLENVTIDYKLPGLLIIDTPGHESFTNLRSRGSSLCNIAILVVDIMHGLEPQTLESLRMLRDRKTPFVVALNKIDRMYGWDATPDGGFQESLARQNTGTKREFETRLNQAVTAFAEQGLNAKPYYDNKDLGRIVSLVPTSAHTGEGIPDLLMLLIKLTQERMTNNLMYLSELECTVLEVKVEEGLGHTLDVVLSNGVLREKDRIVVCGISGAIATNVRTLLTPQPLKELRIRGSWVHHKEVKAALGVKIVADGLEKAVAGSRLIVVTEDDDEDEIKLDIMSDLVNLLSSVDKTGRGVYVQASTLGSLEALLEFLRTSEIPVSGINIGPVHKRDVVRTSANLERAPEYALLLAFDVPVDKDAARLAEEVGVKIFTADIIYHLFDSFKAHMAQVTEAKRKDSAPKAVWPCRLKIIKVFASRDPIIMGVDIIEGTLRIGTPLCVVKTETDPTTKKVTKRSIVSLGKVTSLEINHKSYDLVKKEQVGAGVAIKIEHAVYEHAKQAGRHFTEKDEVISLITRESIDVLKETFRKDVSTSEWMMIKQMKPLFDIA